MLEPIAYGAAVSHANSLALGITNMRVEDTTIYFTNAQTGQEVSITIPIPNVETEISTDKGNQIETRENGLYVGKSYTEITQAEYDVLPNDDTGKLNGIEYRTTDTGRIYKNGVLYSGDKLNNNLIIETYTSLPEIEIVANGNGRVELDIPDATEYISDGYTGYILSAFLWDSSIVSNPLSLNVSSGGKIAIVYMNNYSRTTATPRVSIMWKK